MGNQFGFALFGPYFGGVDVLPALRRATIKTLATTVPMPIASATGTNSDKGDGMVE